MPDNSEVDVNLNDLTREELIELLEAQLEGGIRISFAGKADARKIARRVRPRITKYLSTYSAGGPEDQAPNQVLDGDNLQAMATLYRERGQVDLVLTDPPYNTGNDFRYSDRWMEDPNDTDIGDFIDPDDRSRHTKWMRFMWPRLQMMRSMLKPGGVLAICIDHRELFHLGQMLDELFRPENRIAIINWQKSYAPRNDNLHVSTATEYVLVYAKDIDKVRTGLLERTAAMDARYGNPDNDPQGDWQADNPLAGEGNTHPGMVYAIQSPFTGELHYPLDGTCWRSERPRMKTWLEEWGGPYESRDLNDGMPTQALVIRGVPIPTPDDHPLLVKARKRAQRIRAKEVWPQLIFLKEGAGKPRLKRYLNQVKKGVVPVTYWAADEYDFPAELGSTSWDHAESGHSQTGINEVDAILGKGHGFTTVKPLRLFQKIIQLWCPPEGLVLDPFAGSGTTGHAILAMNHITGARRRFILIEQGRPDRGDPYAKALTAKRLQRVVSGKWANRKGKAMGGGYRFLQLEKRVDADALLHMERSEMVDTVIASHFDDRRRGQTLIRIDDPAFRYLVAKNTEGDGIFLVWDGPDRNTNFTEEVYEVCAEEAMKAELRPTYHVYARYNLYQTDNVRFYQIPDRILADFGLDLSSEPFGDLES